MHGVFSLSFLVAVLPTALAFTFNTTTPTQCGQITVNWDGGQEPFHLIIVPTIEVDSGHITNISIPTGLTAPYSYTFDLTEPAGLEMLISMGDASGWGTGGTTPVLTVGSSSNTSCLDDNLLYDFFFSTSPTSNPGSCSSMTITWDANATRPLALHGMIPSGSAFSLPISQSGGTTSYDWTVDIASGTQFLLIMSDSGPYQTGGSTGLLTVGSGSSNCINSTSPRVGATSSSSSTSASSTSASSTSASSSSASSSSASSSSASSSSASQSAAVTGVGGSSSGGSASDTAGSSKKSTPTGAIVGGTLGGVAFIVLLALLLICCIRRRSKTRKDNAADPAIKSYGVSNSEKKGRYKPVNLAESGLNRAGSDGRPVEMNGAVYEPSPYRYPSPPQTPGEAFNTSPARGVAAGGMMALAAGGKSNSPNTSNNTGTTTPSTPTMPAANPNSNSNRPSVESNRSTTNSPHTNPHSGIGAAPTVRSAAATDVATQGHGPVRGSSIRKPPTGQLNIPPPLSPIVTAPVAGQNGVRPLPDTPTRERETRFVQHEDAGEIVDLPPRYDQLRTRNPDQAE